MTANDYYTIQQARARREGLRRGALLALPVCMCIGVAVMAAIHIGLSAYADRQHDETVRLLTVERDTCRADVARYKEIAALEVSYANRRAYP